MPTYPVTLASLLYGKTYLATSWKATAITSLGRRIPAGRGGGGGSCVGSWSHGRRLWLAEELCCAPV